MNRAEQRCELSDVVQANVALQQHVLPVVVRFGHCLHADQMLSMILEEECRNGAVWAQAAEVFQRARLAVDALRIGAPFHGHAQTRQGLFHDEAGAPGALYQDGAVGDPALERAQDRLLVSSHNPARAKERYQFLGPLDIDRGIRQPRRAVRRVVVVQSAAGSFPALA